MRILLDTNIIIPLEDSSILNQELATLTQLAHKHGCNLLCHPSSLKDIQNDKDTLRKNIMFSKIKKYNFLDSPPTPKQDFLTIVDGKTVTNNDYIDNELLFAVYQDCVDVLVTEDKKLHKKANRIGISSRVYYVEQCVETLRTLYQRKQIVLPNIEETYVYNVFWDDPIFNSLKIDYPEFNEWFRRISREGRKAWIVPKSDNPQRLSAICIFKEEINENIIPVKTNKVLKLCTFKVGEDSMGRKIGELLLKQAFSYCLENSIDALYLTTFAEKHKKLVNLCEEFGFKSVSTGTRGEQALYKSFIQPSMQVTRLTPLEYHIDYYPYYRDGEEIRKFIVPVIPRFHQALFPDCQKQLSFFYPNNAVNNSILKAYICNSKTTQIRSGDLLLFYRSHDEKAITTLGIVETCIRTRNPMRIAAMVGKRTVYSLEEIEGLCKQEALVLLFRQVKHFQKYVPYSKLTSEVIIKNKIESITRIGNEQFKKVMSLVQN